jgi:hypothetical protein
VEPVFIAVRSYGLETPGIEKLPFTSVTVAGFEPMTTMQPTIGEPMNEMTFPATVIVEGAEAVGVSDFEHPSNRTLINEMTMAITRNRLE